MANSQWKRFYGRALREAAEMVGINSRPKVIGLIVIQTMIALGLLGWTGATGLLSATPTRVLTVAAPFLAVIPLFLWKAISVGPARPCKARSMKKNNEQNKRALLA